LEIVVIGMNFRGGPWLTRRQIKNLLFGLFFFIFLLLMLEWFLGLFRLADHDKEFLLNSTYPVFVRGEGEHVGDYVTSPHFADILNFQSFPQVKEEGSFRIFIIGSSAAYGWPYNENYSFSGYLRRALNGASPRKFEIINAAGVSFGSHRELDILKDVVLFDPDLVVIFCGNNEYVERNVLTAMPDSQNVVGEMRSLLGKSNIYRMVRLGVKKAAPGVLRRQAQTDLTDIRSDPFVRRGTLGRSPEVDSIVLNNYRANILAMKKMLVAKGIKGLFCTVPTNVAGWQPYSVPPKFATTEQSRKWSEIDKEVEILNKHNVQGEPKSLRRTAALMEEAVQIAPEHAGSIYTLGQVHLALKVYELAYRELIRAKDVDARPVRALSSFNDAIRSISEESKGIFIADIENSVAEVIRHGLTEGIFLDYCHFTLEGNKFIAISLLPELQRSLDIELPIINLDSFIHSDHQTFENNLMFSTMDQYARALTFYNNGVFDKARDAFENVLDNTPTGDPRFASPVMGNLGYTYAALGDMVQYRRLFRKALETDPDNPLALREMGNILMQDKEFDEAIVLFQRMIKKNPYAPEAFEGMGEIARQTGKPEEAIAYYTDAIKMGGDNLVVRKGMGNTYMALGNKEEAIMAWRKALEFDPSDREIRAALLKYSGGI
jgi:tetratricopeptide (TPR) repeat protein